MKLKTLILPAALSLTLMACNAQSDDETPTATPAPSALPSLNPGTPSNPDSLTLSLANDLHELLPVMMDEDQMLDSLLKAGFSQLESIEQLADSDDLDDLFEYLFTVASHFAEWSGFDVGETSDQVVFNRNISAAATEWNAEFGVTYYQSGRLNISDNGQVNIDQLTFASDGRQLELTAQFNLDAKIEGDSVSLANTSFTIKAPWLEFELDIQQASLVMLMGSFEYQAKTRIKLSSDLVDVSLIGNQLKINDLSLNIQEDYGNCETGQARAALLTGFDVEEDYTRCEDHNTKVTWAYAADLTLASGETVKYKSDLSIDESNQYLRLELTEAETDVSNWYSYHYHESSTQLSLNDSLEIDTDKGALKLFIQGSLEFNDYYDYCLNWSNRSDSSCQDALSSLPPLPNEELSNTIGFVVSLNDKDFGIAVDLDAQHIATLSRSYTDGLVELRFFETEVAISEGHHLGNFYEQNQITGQLIHKNDNGSESFYARVNGTDHLIYSFSYEGWYSF